MRFLMPFSFIGALCLALCSGLNNRVVQSRTSQPTAHQSKQPTVVFDLGGVLVDTDKSKVMWQIGPMALFNYWRHSQNPHALKEKLYEVLNKVSGIAGNLDNVRDDEGNLMPLLMVEWMRGTRPNAEILNSITTAIQENPNWFTSTAEQKVVKSLATVIFTPHIFAKTRCLKPGAVDLVTSCKDRGFKIMGVSNWDAESIVYMKQQYPELFDLFDHLVISGDVHAIKPEPEIFKSVVQNVSPDHCIYIDDQAENIEAAQKLGMHTIRVYADGDTPVANVIHEHLTAFTPDKAAHVQTA